MKRLQIILFGLLIFSFANAANKDWKTVTENPDYIHRAIKEVTDVIVYDIYSPPVASRTYAYVCVAAYEIAIHADSTHITLAGQLHGLNTLPQPEAGKEYSYALAAVHAILTVAKPLVLSEEKIEAFHEEMMREFKHSGIPQDVYDNSVAYGKQVADFILAWASQDNYKQTRSLPKYAVSEDAATWKPTPPSYMKAIEPYWSRIRTFLIDSAQEFKPLPATKFSTDKKSKFYKEAKQVHDTVIHLSGEQRDIANFWDCNPFKMNVNGHVMYATKKISPGGHWINITGVACKKMKADLVQTAEAYACVSVTIADAFISCWDEKYRSNIIRPETYINQYIDESWLPILQTPPFPEYTSGHSVVSGASSVVLTKLFGDHFSYTDSTETEFELAPRNFTSFQQAAEEAAISRLYGGIHYMAAIKNGLTEGRNIGSFAVKKLKTRK